LKSVCCALRDVVHSLEDGTRDKEIARVLIYACSVLTTALTAQKSQDELAARLDGLEERLGAKPTPLRSVGGNGIG